MRTLGRPLSSLESRILTFLSAPGARRHSQESSLINAVRPAPLTSSSIVPAPHPPLPLPPFLGQVIHSSNNTVIKAAIITAELLFGSNESHMVYASQGPSPRSGLSGPGGPPFSKYLIILFYFWARKCFFLKLRSHTVNHTDPIEAHIPTKGRGFAEPTDSIVVAARGAALAGRLFASVGFGIAN